MIIHGDWYISTLNSQLSTLKFSILNLYLMSCVANLSSARRSYFVPFLP